MHISIKMSKKVHLMANCACTLHPYTTLMSSCMLYQVYTALLLLTDKKGTCPPFIVTADSIKICYQLNKGKKIYKMNVYSRGINESCDHGSEWLTVQCTPVLSLMPVTFSVMQLHANSRTILKHMPKIFGMTPMECSLGVLVCMI